MQSPQRIKCGAKTRKPGHPPCEAWAMEGRDRCRMHGGGSPRGMDSPQTIHGRYSKDLPTHLAARFKASMDDPDVLNLTSEIALLDSRIGELLGRVYTGESGQFWRELKALFKQWDNTRDADEKEELLGQIRWIINEGHLDTVSWDELMERVEQRRKLSESEAKRREKMGVMVQADEAMLMATALAGVVRRHVDDPETLRAINRDFALIYGAED